MRLLRPENKLTLENLLTPVRKVNFTCASLNLTTEYSPRRKSRFARASSGFARRVEDRLVVFVHQHRHPPPGAFVQRLDQAGEAFRAGRVRGADARAPLRGVQLRRQVRLQVTGLREATAAEVEADDGMADGPVPTVVDVQPLEQRLVALEQLLQGVHEQALAEAPRTRQEVVSALFRQPLRVRGLVYVVPALLTDRAEGLDADGQLAFHREYTLSLSPWAVKIDMQREVYQGVTATIREFDDQDVEAERVRENEQTARG